MLKIVALVLASLALSEAAKFPTGLSPCPGYENHPFQFISGSLPDVFTYPGSVSISYHAKRQVDLPSDLIMGFKLRKVGPNAVEYEVPCVGGLGGTGSCEYEVCDPHYFTKEVCGQYPSWQQCGCPFKAGEVHLKNIKYTLPDVGFLGKVMTGNYEGKALFYSKSNPDNILGCVNMAFAIAGAKGRTEL